MLPTHPKPQLPPHPKPYPKPHPKPEASKTTRGSNPGELKGPLCPPSAPGKDAAVLLGGWVGARERGRKAPGGTHRSKDKVGWGNPARTKPNRRPPGLQCPGTGRAGALPLFPYAHTHIGAHTHTHTPLQQRHKPPSPPPLRILGSHNAGRASGTPRGCPAPWPGSGTPLGKEGGPPSRLNTRGSCGPKRGGRPEEEEEEERGRRKRSGGAAQISGSAAGGAALLPPFAPRLLQRTSRGRRRAGWLVGWLQPPRAARRSPLLPPPAAQSSAMPASAAAAAAPEGPPLLPAERMLRLRRFPSALPRALSRARLAAAPALELPQR